MNLLIVSEAFFPEGRGGELATYLYAKLLNNSGVDVRVITASTSSITKGKIDGLIIYKIPTRKLTKYSIMSKIPILFKGYSKRLFEWSDIIYMTGWFPAIPFIKHKFRKSVVVHLHSSFPACPIGTAYDLTRYSLCTLNKLFPRCIICIKSYERFNAKGVLETMFSSILNSIIGLGYINFLKYADAVIFVSKFQRELVLKRLQTTANRFFVIYNPLPKLPYIPVKGDDFGYFGGTNPLKGFRVLIHAWSKVCSKYNSKLHISLAEKLLKHKVTFEKMKINLYGKLSGHIYDEVYKNIKAVLVPSVAPEALPYVVSEACLRGRVVIASRVGGIPEQVKGLKGIRLVEPGNVNELAEMIEEVLMMDKKEAVELGMKNREDILRKFDNSKIVNCLIYVFEKISG